MTLGCSGPKPKMTTCKVKWKCESWEEEEEEILFCIKTSTEKGHHVDCYNMNENVIQFSNLSWLLTGCFFNSIESRHINCRPKGFWSISLWAECPSCHPTNSTNEGQLLYKYIFANFITVSHCYIYFLLAGFCFYLPVSLLAIRYCVLINLSGVELKPKSTKLLNRISIPPSSVSTDTCL